MKKLKKTKPIPPKISECEQALEASLDYIEKLQLTIADLEAELEDCESREETGQVRPVD
jgi:hypothetical protein